MDLVAALIAALSVAAVTFRPIFGSLEEFSECIRYALTPDILSFFMGEYGEDFIAELKLGVWIAISAAAGYRVYLIVPG